MATWEFGTPKDSSEAHSDGTAVPHRYQDVFLDGVKIGYVEIHMHKRSGADHEPDVSFGFTGVVYSLPTGGN